jgi:putative molybdopterin biosynthesis protein
VKHIQLSYLIEPSGLPQSLIHNPLMGTLHAVQKHGSISAAAKALELSYRHVWGQLKRWEAEIGQPLLLWEKGQSARLSPLGVKLLYAERQAQARLAPQIEALRAELERSFAMAFEPTAHVLQLCASHDNALARLRTHCAAQQLHLDISFMGSIDAIRALNEGRCEMAGFHTSLPTSKNSLAQRTYQDLLQPGLHKIIGFAQRAQGLIVPHGNPQGVQSLADVQRQKLRFANRPLGTGTRLLLDDLLAMSKIKPNQITGYQRTEPSHAAVAHAVLHGSADVGLGIAVAAAIPGLHFVPLVQERYDLVCLKSALQDPAVKALCTSLQHSAWKKQINQLTGYKAEQSGQVLSLTQTLPWWNFD